MKFPRAQAYWAATRSQIASDRNLYLFIAAYVLVMIPFVGINPMLMVAFLAAWMLKYWLLLPALFGIFVGMRLLMAPGGRRGTAIAIAFGPERMSRYLAGSVFLVATAFFQATFTTAKIDFSHLSWGFPYDQLQAEIDRLIHFGVDPFRILYAIAKDDIVLKMVEIFYNRLWFFVIFGVLFYVAVSPRANAIRQRYVLSYILTWGIVGSLFAAIFHSAGPVFYHLATGDTARFAEQLQFLTHTIADDNSTFNRAAGLWLMRAESTWGIGGGISAFPSVHVAVSALNMFFAWEISRRLGAIATAYLVAIMLSSVYLGWHYAIDGYASLVLVAGIYYGVRLVMSHRWRLALRPAGATAAVPQPVPAASASD